MSSNKQTHPLISSHPSTSGLKIALHPLALLTISDYITRHTLRRIPGPIIGALLGSQSGRQISIEHAYEIKLVDDDVSKTNGAMDIEGETPLLRVDDNWFKTKLQQFKDVHKTLDVVGHFTLLPPPPNNLPTSQHLQTHNELLQYNESLIFLGFHPSPLSTATGGKLPLTCWESVYEEEQGKGESKELKMKFVEIEYAIETGEAEMIAMSYVAAGAGNAGGEEAGMVPSKDANKPSVVDTATSKGKGKGKEAVVSETKAEVEDKDIELPAQTQELLANLNAKSGAIRMLHSRLILLLAYLRTLEQSQGTITSTASTTSPYPLLRSLSALVTRLSLLEPPSTNDTSLQHEQLAEQSDVLLTALLGYMTKSVNEVRKVGAKYSVVSKEHEQQQRMSIMDMDSGAAAGGGGGNGDRGGGLGGRYGMGLHDARKGVIDFIRKF